MFGWFQLPHGSKVWWIQCWIFFCRLSFSMRDPGHFRIHEKKLYYYTRRNFVKVIWKITLQGSLCMWRHVPSKILMCQISKILLNKLPESKKSFNWQLQILNDHSKIIVSLTWLQSKQKSNKILISLILK